MSVWASKEPSVCVCVFSSLPLHSAGPAALPSQPCGEPASSKGSFKLPSSNVEFLCCYPSQIGTRVSLSPSSLLDVIDPKVEKGTPVTGVPTKRLVFD